MEAKIENQELRISLHTLMESLSKEDRAAAARVLVADEYLWKAVLECVADEGGHYFQDDGHWWWDSRTVLEFRQKLIPLMPENARLAVLEALRQRDSAKAEQDRHAKWAWQMFHSWPREHLGPPAIPDWVYPQEVIRQRDAAPELLRALEALLDYSEKKAAGESMPLEYFAVRDTARAAIEQAGGTE